MRVLIAGCGYVGLSLGAELVRAGHEVSGLRRSPSARTELEAAGLQPLFADLTQPADLAALPLPFDWVVNCVSAGGGGVEEYRRVYWEGTRNLVEWLARTPLRRFVYTSSTGVYGQNDGSDVDESAPTEPPTETGQVLVETERVLLAAARARGFPAVVLRVAGIYGPGRGSHLKQFLRGEARLEGGGRRWLNLIHRDDVAGAVIAALERGVPGETYNVVDDEPVPQRALYAWLAAQLRRPPPPSVPEDPDALRKRGVTNKRVLNGRLKRELGWQPRFPRFREGLAESLREAQTLRG